MTNTIAINKYRCAKCDTVSNQSGPHMNPQGEACDGIWHELDCDCVRCKSYHRVNGLRTDRNVQAKTYDTAAHEQFKLDLNIVLKEIGELLIQKNFDYGDSALNPVRILSKQDTVEQIKVRIDDKLSRLAHGQAGSEDVEKDLTGYFVLLRIARLRESQKDFQKDMIEKAAMGMLR